MVASKLHRFAECISELLPTKPAPGELSEITDYIDYKTVQLNEAMACCHSITYVDGLLIGDPLEIKMFESTKWQLNEP